MTMAGTVVPVLLVAALATATLVVPGESGNRPELASPWVAVGSARVRLLAGPPATKGSTSYLAGVEITLAEGWKTYWRTPGDAGVPPVFNWAGSANLATAGVRYPAPMRLPEPGAQTIGYKGSVLFPVEVVPADPAKAVGLKLAFEFGVCREICIPAEATLQLDLHPALRAGEASPAILAALTRVPRSPAERRPQDPEIAHVSARLGEPSPGLTIAARFPGGAEGADLFVEAPEGLYVPQPARVGEGTDGTVRFEVDLGRGDAARELRGKALTFTLVSGGGASERTWTMP